MLKLTHRVDRLQGRLHDGAEFACVRRNPALLHAFGQAQKKVSSGEA